MNPTRRIVVEDFASFREHARRLLHEGVKPSDLELVAAEERQASLFTASLAGPGRSAPAESFKSPIDTDSSDQTASSSPLRVPREFMDRACAVSLHRSPERWALLYRLLWRLRNEQPHLLSLASDPDVRRFELMAREVRTDEHRVHAFARFRRVELDGTEHFVAWHRTDHFVLRPAAEFFQRRFGEMRWSLLTPDESAHWDGSRLSFGPGVPRSEAPTDDELESLWRTYYASTFNPARLNLRAMGRDMPARYRSTMPELGLLPGLVASAPARTRGMTRSAKRAEADALEGFLPPPEARGALETLRRAAMGCEACPLHAHATQTVFGEGPIDARIVLVGEQPGDQEDREGHPFIGPAGGVLDEALREAGLDRGALYLTNAVKHFKWAAAEGAAAGPGYGPSERRRIHQRPSGPEIRTCKGWLEAELRAVRPQLVVCLGATAATALLGSGFRINHSRGRVFELPEWGRVLATWHPSAVLRSPEDGTRERARRELVADLRLAAETVALSQPQAG